MKMNWVYFGDECGIFLECIVVVMFVVVCDVDFIVDFYQGLMSWMIDEVCVCCGCYYWMYVKCFWFVKMFGCGYVFDQKGFDG